MFKKKRKDNPESYVKYTKFGYPYLEVDKFLASERGKELDKRMEIVSDILKEKLRLRVTKDREQIFLTYATNLQNAYILNQVMR